MNKLKLINGMSERKAELKILEPGDVFEHQDEIFMRVETHLTAQTDQRYVVNLSLFKLSLLHAGTIVWRVEAEMVLK